MVDRGVLSRLRHQRDLTAYLRRLGHSIEQTPALRALPGLLSVALPIVNEAGGLAPLRAALGQVSFVTLAGTPGSGRRLVMQQLALYFARRADASSVPALIELTELDDGGSAPLALLEAHLRSLYLPGPAPARERRTGGPDAARQDYWLLLVHGLELLPMERRQIWRAALRALPAQRRGSRAIVSVSDDEPAWPGFEPLRIAQPSQALVARWLQQLCPTETQARLKAALEPGGLLAGCAERLFEIALLAWLATPEGLPHSRAALYARALDAIPAELERYGAERTAPLGHPQLGRFALARRIVAEGRFRLLADLTPPDRAETAVLAAGVASGSELSLAALWRARTRGDDVAFALGRCLLERPPSSLVWVLRIATALGSLAGRGGAAGRSAAELLHRMLPELDRSLDRLAGAERPARRLVSALLRALPLELALPRAQRLALTEIACEPLAWTAADLLVELAPSETQLGAPGAGVGSLGRWAYVHLLASSQRRALVHPGAIRALAGSGAGEARLLRAGGALLNDTSLSHEARLGGLGLVRVHGTEQAQAIIRPLCEDPATAVRQAALEALEQIDPLAAEETLRRVAARTEAPWPAQLNAVLRLGERDPAEAGALLETRTRDATLPLFARLQIATRLGERADSDVLARLLQDQECAESIRAAAARLLAARRHPDVPALLDQPRHAAELRRAACDGLREGAAEDDGILGALLTSLAIAVDKLDTEGAIAALGAIGRIKSSECVPEVAEVLGAATVERMLGTLPLTLVQQSPEECFASPGFPAALRLPLATTLARALTPADRPTTLHEFLLLEIDRVRAAAALALGEIGGEAALTALRAALRQPASETTAAAIAALGAIGGPAALVAQLGAQDVPTAVSWQIVRRLEHEPEAESALAAALDRADLDPFTRGALAEALGRLGARSSLLLLSQIARDPLGDSHVQAQAITALGMLDEPAAEVVLLRIFADSTAYGEELRGLAARCLPRRLGDESRRVLREALRTERAPGAVVAGALSALGRAEDRESLALALRYCLDERPSVVRAALTALADIGETTVTPVLARTAQAGHVDHIVRLQAIGALLRLGGHEHRLLLKPYLEHGSPLIQLRALDELIGAGASTAELAELLADRSKAPPLRVRALEQIAGEAGAVPALITLVGREDELQLRCRAAQALGLLHSMEATTTLAELALRSGVHDALRYRCIEALGRIGGTEAWLALSNVAQCAEAGDVAAAWAARTLEQSVDEAMR
jgi:HEAT repeat protein